LEAYVTQRQADHSFDHFLEAQSGCYSHVLAELRAGRKRTHWMWFIFPQLRGLGHSAMADRFGLSGLEEAKAFLAHPVLGKRLVECSMTALGHQGEPADSIFGTVDAIKLRSCMTLFDRAAPDESVFKRVLEAFFDAKPDALTLAHLTETAP
jgi:uncharacterized protein (DUF1810 family)